MRWLVVAVLGAGCGRVAFDEVLDVIEDTACLDPLVQAGEPYAGVTSDGAHLICTTTQWNAISAHPEHFTDAFVLGADLDFAGVAYSIVGSDESPFNGSVDGGGHSIANVIINTEDVYTGLIAHVDGGTTIRNLDVRGFDITGIDYVGGLVGYVLGSLTVEDVTLSGTLTGSDSLGAVAGYVDCVGRPNCSIAIRRVRAEPITVNGQNIGIGGIVGVVNDDDADSSILSDVSSAGTVVGQYSVGGIVGQSVARIERATSSASIEAFRSGGGLVGSTGYRPAIVDSIATGTVRCTDGSCGGAVGDFDGTITRTQAHGDVTCDQDECGGLVGFLTGEVHESFTTGSVTGRYNVAGLVGWAHFLTVQPRIADAYATGIVMGDDLVGGLVGSCTGCSITRTYTIGDVTGLGPIGGLAGRLELTAGTMPSLTYSFSALDVTGMSLANNVSSSVGIVTGGVTITELARGGLCTNTAGTCTEQTNLVPKGELYGPGIVTAFDTWDFDTVWEPHASTYPTLRAVPAP